MKKIIFTIIAILSFTLVIAQSDSKEEQLISAFKEAFNNHTIEDIYKMYSKERQAEFSLDRAKSVFNRIHKAKGDIISFKFLKNEEALTIYSADFTNSKEEFVVKLNRNGKADVLNFRKAKHTKK